MEMYIDNDDRKYLGLPIIKENWEMRILNNGEFIYLEANKIVKLIEQKDNSYSEMTLDETLSEDGIWLLPKTEKGKRVKLSSSTIKSRTPLGTYFSWYREIIVIGNFSTQKSFYSTFENNIIIRNPLDLREWLNKWKSNTSDKFQRSIEDFSIETRKHYKFKEGDFFAIKYDRDLYGFGRILLDVNRLRKQKKEKFTKFYGKPVLIKQYAYLSATNKIDISILDKCISFPSHYIMDNALFYGDYEIVGHKDLTDADLDYPILYYRSISFKDLNKINLIIGELYLQIELSTNKYYGKFGQSGIGYCTNIDIGMINKCLDANSLSPYWSSTEFKYDASNDLRNPALRQTREDILAQFGIKE